jgi:hypothetical protein
MNIASKIIAATAVSVFSLISIGGTAFASDKIGHIFITRVDSISDTALKASLENISVDEAATIQSSIRGDADLRDALRSRNVQFNNIIKIERFLDGSAEIFVR